MANYCCTKYAVEGSKDVLQKIAEAINSLKDPYIPDVIQKLGLDTSAISEDFEEWGGGYWKEGGDARVEEISGKSVLFFGESNAWNKLDAIDWIMAKLEQPCAPIYYLSEISEQEEHYTNDVDGKYFPYRFAACTENDDDDVYFVNEADMLKHIRTQYELGEEYATLEKIEAYCEENDLLCYHCEIELDPDLEETICKKGIDWIIKEANYARRSNHDYEQSIHYYGLIGEEAIKYCGNNYAWTYCCAGKYEKALEVLNDYLQNYYDCEEDEVDYAAVLDTLGEIYQGLGQYEKAVETYQKSLDLYKQGGCKSGASDERKKIKALKAQMGQ